MYGALRSETHAGLSSVYGNVGAGNTLKTSSGVTSSGRVSLPVYRHVGGNGVSELAAS